MTTWLTIATVVLALAGFGYFVYRRTRRKTPAGRLPGAEYKPGGRVPGDGRRPGDREWDRKE